MSAEFTRNFCWYVQLRFSPNPQPHISRYRNDLQYFSQLVDSRPTQRHRRCLLAEDVCTPCRGFGMVNGNKRRPRIKRLKPRLLASLSVCSRQTNKQHYQRSNYNWKLLAAIASWDWGGGGDSSSRGVIRTGQGSVTLVAGRLESRQATGVLDVAANGNKSIKPPSPTPPLPNPHQRRRWEQRWKPTLIEGVGGNDSGVGGGGGRR